MMYSWKKKYLQGYLLIAIICPGVNKGDLTNSDK